MQPSSKHKKQASFASQSALSHGGGGVGVGVALVDEITVEEITNSVTEGIGVWTCVDMIESVPVHCTVYAIVGVTVRTNDVHVGGAGVGVVLVDDATDAPVVVIEETRDGVIVAVVVGGDAMIVPSLQHTLVCSCIADGEGATALRFHILSKVEDLVTLDLQRPVKVCDTFNHFNELNWQQKA